MEGVMADGLTPNERRLLEKLKEVRAERERYYAIAVAAGALAVWLAVQHFIGPGDGYTN
jgi:hypothetical protein